MESAKIQLKGIYMEDNQYTIIYLPNGAHIEVRVTNGSPEVFLDHNKVDVLDMKEWYEVHENE